jgi:4-amino-4-deoxy-L-arabinose transferase-like glycosyltransferase
MRYSLIVAGLLIGTLLLKLINITSLPLYLDEGLYVYWAHLFAQDSSAAYISLLDGKTPLFIWLVSWVNQFFSDYLFSARLISVVAGTISILAWSQIVRIISTPRISLIFIILTIITPFLYIVDRMAFVDSTMTAFASMSLLLITLSVKFMKSRSYFLSFLPTIFAGVLLGFAYFTKTTAHMFLVLSLIVLIFQTLVCLFQKRFIPSLFILLSALLLFVVQHELVNYLSVGGYRYWPGIVVKEGQLSYSLTEVILNLQIDRVHYLFHLSYLLDYLYVYIGILLFFVPLGVLAVFRNHRSASWLFVYSVVIIGGIFLSAKVMASRYFYPVTFPIIALSSFGLAYFWAESHRLLKLSLIMLFIILCIPISLIIFAPQSAHYAHDDKAYFVSGDINAPGLLDVSEYLIGQTDSFVGIYGIWGVSEGSLAILSEQRIETIVLGQWIEKYSRNELSSCPSDQRLIGEFCYKLTIDKLFQSPKPNKYLYLTRENPDQSVELLKKLTQIEIIKTYIRPYSQSKAYLIKLLP